MLIDVALGRGGGIFNRGVRRWLFISRSAASSPAPCRCCFSEIAPPAAGGRQSRLDSRAAGAHTLGGNGDGRIAHERFHRPFGGREDLPRRGGCDAPPLDSRQARELRAKRKRPGLPGLFGVSRSPPAQQTRTGCRTTLPYMS